MYLAIKKVTPLDNYKLLLYFENDEKRIFDLSPYLNLGKFTELKDLSLFNSARINFDTVEWANHLDMDPEFLYLKSTPCN